ncbi:uncharacterized protein TrAtP1_005982 [Trichoderma atroviride]|uniref:uncharacterized protein n=1 Tax=Hypocrea atroviridis TaxID=63577 RepID=UPI00331D94D5|nr:hypothetical protein TrAtP1_005982 [Trichoderma atroviride]
MAHHFSPTSPNFTLFATKNDFLFSRACCSFLSASRPRDDLFILSHPSLLHPLFSSSHPLCLSICLAIVRFCLSTYRAYIQKISAANSAASIALDRLFNARHTKSRDFRLAHQGHRQQSLSQLH